MSHQVRFSGTKYSIFQPLLIVFVLMALWAGKCNEGECDVFARVTDQSGLDGCGLMFELKDKTLLLPANLDDYDIQVADGDTVSMSYQIIPDAMSVCMREDATVSLSCIEVISN
jgi:hypothetical protein